MQNVWNKQGSSYKLDEVSYQTPDLPVGVYKMELNSLFNYLYLNHISDQFEFPYKVYGTQFDFVNRVVKSWQNTDGNMGVLLTGLKGTGKTVTAQMICNTMKLPVIIVSFHSELLVSFINSINQNVIILIDEFEKIYDRHQNSLLSVMDGVLKTSFRKMFLLTTNEMTIEQNMLLRPSRIRYIKNFTDMEMDTIIEIVDDNLKYPEHRASILNTISELSIITIDIVKSIVEEVNIHAEDPTHFTDIFNIHTDDTEMYNVYEIKEDGFKTEVETKVRVHPNSFNTYHEGDQLYIGGVCYGVIEKYINKSQLLVNTTMSSGFRLNETAETETKSALKLMYFEPAVRKHRNFYNTLAF